MDGKNLPCVLGINKVDLLLEDEDIDDDNGEYWTFIEENKFDGYFKISAKNGTNIKESVNFLIEKIFERINCKDNKSSSDIYNDETIKENNLGNEENGKKNNFDKKPCFCWKCLSDCFW